MKILRTLASVILSGLVLAGSCGCGRQAGVVEDQTGAGSAAGMDREKTDQPEAPETELQGQDCYINADGIVIRRGRQLTIGFSQIGAESDWRLASSASMEQVFTSDNGYNLIFSDGQQKQENQIKAIREFIGQDVDYIILDPPRDGVHPKALGRLAGAGAKRIVYVSCKPASLARDLPAFFWAGYRAEKMAFADLFPKTDNCEAVALLSKLGAA